MTRNKAFKRAVRGRMARTGEHYTTARSRLIDRPANGRVAITNGDSAGGTLRQARLADTVIAWKDPLCEGPVPALPPARLRGVRAEYLATRYGYVARQVEEDLAARDRALSRHAGDELTLWFEGDMLDQLQVVQVLERLRRRHGELTMVSISEHPDSARFGGLGELNPEQLTALLPMARPISDEGIFLASRTWAALTSPEPSELIALRGIVSSELRYLGDALRRLLQEYPSRTDGLSLTQRRILLAVAGGLDTVPQVLRAHWQVEARPFLGDLGVQAELHDLSRAVNPAIALSSDRRYALTPFGVRLLGGEADWAEANGMDRWIGGVHLEGHGLPWRYDERLETVIRA